jgi:hypothetical protein
MWIKITILISFSLAMIAYGIFWFSKSFSLENRYDFNEDLKKSFFSIHWKNEGFFNDNRPRRIIPIMLILGGIGILCLGLIKVI